MRLPFETACRWLCILVLAGFWPLDAITAQVRPPSERSAAVLLTALGEYVAKFERAFSSAVAEERYVQLIRPVRDTPAWPSDERAIEWHEGPQGHPRTGPILDRRQLLSDMLLAHTPEGWVGYRDVAVVDGGAVRQRADRVTALFLSRGSDRGGQLRRIAEESARFNIGGFKRTLNIPTLALSFLHARHHPRFTFTSGGREQLDDWSTEVIRYEEQTKPTLIGTQAGEDVSITGRVWIDTASSTVVQTEVRVLTDDRRGTLITRYRSDPRFEVLVPDYMWEWYDGGRTQYGSTFERTVIECLARYGNYRAFSVTTNQQIR